MKKGIGLLVLCMLLIVIADKGYGSSQLPLFMAGEDVGNGYRYEVSGIGSFTVNGRDGEVLPAAAIDLSDDLEAILYQDGEVYEFEQSGVIIENGDYELHLYRKGEKGSGLYAVFHFTVQNDYHNIMQGGQEMQLVKYPPLSLRYDSKDQMYGYTLPDGAEFRMSVPLGGSSRTSVALKLSEELMAFTMRRDGEVHPLPEELIFYEPGHYEIAVTESGMNYQSEIVYQTNICFVIRTGQAEPVSLVYAPEGFYLQSAFREGKALELTYNHAIYLVQDGTYEFVFVQKDNREVIWEESLIRDTQPPAIRFSVPVDGQVLRQEVSFLPMVRGETMRILHNGAEIQASQNKIASDGRYLISVSDEAGNRRDYQFMMKQSRSLLDVRMIVLLAGSGLVIAGAMLYWRRHLRVI